MGWEELNNKEKRKKGERVTLWLLHSFNIIIKEASTGNVIIPKCEMCVFEVECWVKAGNTV